MTALLVAIAIFLVTRLDRTMRSLDPSAGAHRRFLLSRPSQDHDVPTGLSELLGRSTPLDRRAPRASATWDPTSAWFRQQPMTSLFPTCQHPQWCDDQYRPDETDRIQRAMWEHQNPADCGSARYLVLDSSWAPPLWATGFGSSLHMHMFYMALALTDDRILVTSDRLQWSFAPPEVCGKEEPNDDNVWRGGTGQSSAKPPDKHPYMDCFFLPTTRCQPSTEEVEAAPKVTSLHQPDRIVRMRAYYKHFNTSFCELTVQSSVPALAAFQDKPPSWWYAQVAKFVLRPTEHTLRDLVWPLQQTAFYRTRGRLPHPLAAVFIRAGDKGTEAPLRTVDEHFAVLGPVASVLGIKDVYVGTDSADRLEEAVIKYGKTYRIHYINWQRHGRGLAMPDVLSAGGTTHMADLVRLALADMAITAQADVLIGTLSSNWARLTDELRRANGKARVPYLTPEKKLHYSACELTGAGGEIGSAEHVANIAGIVEGLRRG